MADQCKTCRFWFVSNVFRGVTYGECKRFPPSPVVIDEDIEDRRPLMAHDDWCGEYSITPTKGGQNNG